MTRLELRPSESRHGIQIPRNHQQGRDLRSHSLFLSILSLVEARAESTYGLSRDNSRDHPHLDRFLSIAGGHCHVKSLLRR